VVLSRSALECAYCLRGGRVIVVSDDLDLATVDTVRSINFVGGKLRS
jgi:hypothetical protein